MDDDRERLNRLLDDLWFGRHDLATLVTQLMEVEVAHRALGRVIAGVRPV